MTPRQLARLEVLDSMEFLTPDEHAEHANLLRLSSEMRQAFELLKDQNMRPTWVGGEYIIANGNSIVRGMADAYRLLSA